MRLIDRHSIIEEVLEEWAPSLAGAHSAYRGHTYRVYNFARRILGSDRQNDALAIASVFHDIGIWSDRTFDYLGPSAARAGAYVREHAPQLPSELVGDLIANHHALWRARAGGEPDVVDAFRRADLVDVTAGFYLAGLDRSFLHEAAQAFPYSGFHAFLLKTALSWFVRHPLRPLPMLRWSASSTEEPL